MQGRSKPKHAYPQVDNAVPRGHGAQSQWTTKEQFFQLTHTTLAYYHVASSPPSKARTACELGTPAAGGAPSGRRG